MDESEPLKPEAVEAIHRAILHTALDCIISIDAAGLVREFNPAAEKVFGFTRAEALGKELAELIIPPRLRSRHREGLARYLATGEGPVLNRRIEINAMRRDGTELLVELAISPLRVSGQPFFTAYLRDITERVRSDRRRGAQYAVASLLAGSLELKDAAHPILEAVAGMGEWALALLWLGDEAQERMSSFAIWQRDERKFGEFALVSGAVQFRKGEGLPGRVWESGKPTWIRDVIVDSNFPRGPAARAVGLHGAFGFPIFAEGKVNGMVEMFCEEPVDPDPDLLKLVEVFGSQIGLFVERRRVEVELQLAKENAEAASAAKDKFLAMLSHELRTPLTPVLIWAAEMSQDRHLSPEMKEGLQMTCRNIELEARLIDDMLDLTRITRGKLKLEPARVDIDDLLERALDIVQREMPDRRLRIEWELDATSHDAVIDGPRFQQVFWNIFRNAYRHTPDGGRITVRTYNPESSRIAIEIIDTGDGIDPKFVERIFDAFEQVDTKREGLGLGLAISKAIVEMHGGSIQARSDGPNKGATFAIELPLIHHGQTGGGG